MNRVARLLAVAGLSLGTAVAIGAGPAQAAPSTPQVTTQSATGGYYDFDDDETVGYFRTLRGCERVGRLGELRDRWDGYDCDRVYRGPFRGAWELTVEDWNDDYDNDNWYDGWYGGYHGGDYRGGWKFWHHYRH